MTDTTDTCPERILHLPTLAQPVHRDGICEQTADPTVGIEAANCGDLTGMARDLCYAQVHGIYY